MDKSFRGDLGLVEDGRAVISFETLINSPVFLIAISAVCIIGVGWAMKKFGLLKVRIWFISIEAQPSVDAIKALHSRKDEPD
ncbi:hypothetical protein CTT39_05940 [Agrobacterium rosae]|nr:hypothetical protein CTT39_05940 [Agrobacterium rosae]